MSRPKRTSTQLDYAARIDRVIAYVRAHLDGPLGLEVLARIACFSPFHFHRVFRAHTGETLRDFVARARLERAALLVGRAGTRRSMTSVAMTSGFSSSAELSRAFRARFDVRPTAYRHDHQKRKKAQEAAARRAYREAHDASLAPLPVRILSMPARRIAYVRVEDALAPESFETAVAALLALTTQHDGMLGISHDDPEVTPRALCRYDLAVVLPDGVPSTDRVGTRVLPAATYVVHAVRGGFDEIALGWDRLFAAWLPSSGYEPDDGPGIERFSAPPSFDAHAIVHVELLLPIREVRGR